MTKLTQQKLNDSAAARWTALAVVSFTMMAAYYVNDVVAPLKEMLGSNLGWSSSEYGFYAGAYSFLNVFLLMLIWGGFILDKFGVRFTGKLATILMVCGTGLEYYGLTVLADSDALVFGQKASVAIASVGYAIFGVGAEVAGITVTKIIAKWFKGKEMATAMGVQVALARIGSQAAFALALPIAKQSNLAMPVFIGLLLLGVGTITFFIFSSMDKKLDSQSASSEEGEDEEKFSFKDVASVLTNRGFWLIALLCVLFYSCVFPFQKFATEFMVLKYGVSEDIAGFIAGSPAIGALFLTPFFGGVIDKRGRSATIMILGSALLIAVHFIYSLPTGGGIAMAIALMVVLGIAFSLVPSAMWPAVAKIFPAHQLGTAYALIFFIQNIGLWGVPLLIGKVLDKWCVVGYNMEDNSVIYNYTLPMQIFTGIAVLALIVAILLRIADRKYGYKLEEPNIK